MAFIKLFPPESGALSIDEIVRRLQDEFDQVLTDADEGQDHVAAMIVFCLRLADTVPVMREQLDWLQRGQKEAVLVKFGDTDLTTAQCCLLPDSDLFFDSFEELKGEARPLLERAAIALGYSLFEG